MAIELEQQFLTFLVNRLDAKLEDLKDVELIEVQRYVQEMNVFTKELRSVIAQIYVDETATPTPQRMVTRRSRRNQISEQQKTGGEQ
jgi:hypothetical protein